MNHRRKRLIQAQQTAREGRRWYAFYQGTRAQKHNRPGNPHPPGSEMAACWEAGWKYAEDEK
ncbi:MAG: hypothetical protein BWX88_03436 [Planctomycetes bacterium ADurb.Bin126]|mgnify:CR=1 FL=1|nr:MAG: hypothetical protein BWX88_03436 [Planctomycetes bacterium ADurb.Bin126]